MCMDYTDLKKVCLKDTYLLTSIGDLMDGVLGYQISNFLNTYSEYNQISMYPPNQDKTTFITERANFYYEVMSFGLKNAGATCQRFMDKIFREHIGRCVEVYVDDMVVHFHSVEDHVKNLVEVFG